MSCLSRTLSVVSAVAFGLSAAGCASTGDAPSGDAAQLEIQGEIASIDTAPWAYDGHAVVQVDTATRGRVSVQLPARWNLCKAAPVDVAALSVGMRIHAVGAADGEGGLVVCSDVSHRLDAVAPQGS